MDNWNPILAEDLKDYSAPVSFMDNALKVAGAIAALFCTGALIVVALGWSA